jgi:NADP-dependent 3-hydroxy acid dehydrogenase YdfG
MSKTIAVFGAGPGMGRSVARRFGREGYRVVLVARTKSRLDALAEELAGDGIEATGYAADLSDRDSLPALVSAMGPIDVLYYGPAGVDWLGHQVDVRVAGPESFEFPLDLLLRTPSVLVREVLPGLLERDEGAVLFALAVTASAPYPQVANVGAAAAAARSYLHSLHVSLAGTGVFAGLVQVGGMVGGSDAARYAMEHWDPSRLPSPLDPDDLAEAAWKLYHARDGFELTVRG